MNTTHLIHPVKTKFIAQCLRNGVELVYGSDWSQPSGYTHQGKEVNDGELLERMKSISRFEYDYAVSFFKLAEVITNGNVNLQTINVDPEEMHTKKIQTLKSNSMFGQMNDQACDALFSQLPIEKKQIVAAVLLELNKAERKHPEWPQDNIHAAAVVAEESGELVRAALQANYENGNQEEMRTEAIQTAAMGIRFAFNLKS